ncbi:MAG: DUF1489 domain-containing protein, partial [Pseudomonadota bacterium]|nr:DUF1489 domain-containing protein [Pseudomonadota bacterium]
MYNFTNLIKLSVGTESVDGLAEWQKIPQVQTPDGLPRHVTRMWPKREKEILAGGSIYWVIKGVIQARQRIVRLDEVTGQDGIRRCAIVLDPELFRLKPPQVAGFGRREAEHRKGPRALQPQAAPGRRLQE